MLNQEESLPPPAFVLSMALLSPSQHRGWTRGSLAAVQIQVPFARGTMFSLILTRKSLVQKYLVLMNMFDMFDMFDRGEDDSSVRNIAYRRSVVYMPLSSTSLER